MPAVVTSGALTWFGQALALCLAATVAVSRSSFACTAALLSHGGDAVVVKSYDYYMGQGQVVVNPRGLAKTSMVSGSEKAVSWVARYGSVTFNQYGRELPASAMNEAGLVGEVGKGCETMHDLPPALTVVLLSVLPDGGSRSSSWYSTEVWRQGDVEWRLVHRHWSRTRAVR